MTQLNHRILSLTMSIYLPNTKYSGKNNNSSSCCNDRRKRKRWRSNISFLFPQVEVSLMNTVWKINEPRFGQMFESAAELRLSETNQPLSDSLMNPKPQTSLSFKALRLGTNPNSNIYWILILWIRSFTHSVQIGLVFIFYRVFSQPFSVSLSRAFKHTSDH